MRKYKLRFFIMLSGIPIASLILDTLVPYFLSQAIGGIINKDSEQIYHNLMMTAIVGILGLIINFVSFQVAVRQDMKVYRGLIASVFGKLIHKDIQFFTNEKVGSLTGKFIDFLSNHITLQGLLILDTMSFILSMAAGITLVSLQSPILGVAIFVIIAFILLSVRYGLKLRQPYRMAHKQAVSEVNGLVADSITNNLIVKTFAEEDYEIDVLSKQAEKRAKAYTINGSLMSVEGTLRITTIVIAQIAALALSAQLVMNGTIDVAIAIFTLTYLQRIAAQLFSLGEMINGYDRAFLAAAPMSEILSQEVQVKDPESPEQFKDISPNIRFENISYRYSSEDVDVLKDINLTIPAGQKVGLIGHSGAGKTTITHLLLRFADVTGGAIKISGQDIRNITQKDLRKNIAYVPQEPMLFHRTIRENIMYGRPHCSNEEFLRAAKQAHALEFIEKLPQSFDTMVGERGVKLSGGQRQRVAIARAILKDAPILVLDEATSALDSQSEKLIQDALEKLMKGRTSIVIAHRLSTIAKLDRILVLSDGKIVEDGTHSELLEQNGTYAKLWSHQSGGFIED